MQDLLRATVCPDAVLEYKPQTRSRKAQPTGQVRPSESADLPVRWLHGDPIASLRIHFRVTFDEHHGRHLMVFQSGFGIVARQVSNAPIVRWEYNRDSHTYSPVHFHLHAESIDLRRLQEMAGQEKPMRDIHFSAGSRRFRPSLEDVIEFVIQEGFAHPQDDWQDAVETTRQQYQRIQLLAAVGTHPGVAIDKLEDEGILTPAEARVARERITSAS